MVSLGSMEPTNFETYKMEPTDFEEKKVFISVKSSIMGQIYKWETFGTHGLKFLTTPLHTLLTLLSMGVGHEVLLHIKIIQM